MSEQFSPGSRVPIWTGPNGVPAAQLVEQQEGVRYFVYDDATGLPIRPGSHVVGHPTIGIGRCMDTEGITPAEAIALAGDDWSRLLVAFRNLPWFQNLNTARQFVVLDMAFQMGYAGLLRFRNMIIALEQKNYDEATRQMLASTWAQETPERAHQLANIMTSGMMPDTPGTQG